MGDGHWVCAPFEAAATTFDQLPSTVESAKRMEPGAIFIRPMGELTEYSEIEGTSLVWQYQNFPPDCVVVAMMRGPTLAPN
jgi:hypothetical protein